MFYTDISSFVLNNRYASKHFHLERRVHQGCPLSSTLFITAIELLVQSIRRSKEIKGITIDINIMRSIFCNMQMTQLYFCLMSNQCQSYLIYYRFFERCSRLKLSQTKSEMLWLGSVRHRKDSILDLQMSGEPVNTLGVHFTL